MHRGTFVALTVALIAQSTVAHGGLPSAVGRAASPCSSPHVPLLSYHVHVLFWPSNKQSVSAAMQLQLDFVEAFGASICCFPLLQKATFYYDVDVVVADSLRRSLVVLAFNAGLRGKPNCTLQAGDPSPNTTEICAFEVDWDPAGPFLTAQYSFFVPPVGGRPGRALGLGSFFAELECCCRRRCCCWDC